MNYDHSIIWPRKPTMIRQERYVNMHITKLVKRAKINYIMIVSLIIQNIVNAIKPLATVKNKQIWVIKFVDFLLMGDVKILFLKNGNLMNVKNVTRKNILERKNVTK